MLALLKLYILVNLHYILVECFSPPELSVSVLDERLIERKRQDTMDMCRIFTEETEKLENINKINEVKLIKSHRRVKRNIKLNPINPALNTEDAERVEGIVDKIYDDLLERGQKIDYRRGDLPAKKNVSTNTSGRRFNFAPLELTGPLATTGQPGLLDTSFSPPGKTPRFKLSIIPYFIDQRTYDQHLAQAIMKAFTYFEKVTCIRLQRLRERPTDRESLQNIEWLYITNPTGIKQCVHSNDRTIIKGVQMIVFGYNCMSLGDILHELMHVLGFSHEHVRPDRDQYITVMWENIKPGYRKYFELVNETAVENMPYDYASVLHYPSRAFSKNGQLTIMTEPGIKVGQRDGLSEIDVEKISALYSSECVKRNREYLLKTCPSVVRAKPAPAKATEEEIEQYYKNRLWAYGIVNFKLRDKMEFTSEERENIYAVIHHIEKETCIEFRDLTSDTSSGSSSETDENDEVTKKSNEDIKKINEDTNKSDEDKNSEEKNHNKSGNKNNDDDGNSEESSIHDSKSISEPSNKTAYGEAKTDHGAKTEDDIEQLKTDYSDMDNEIDLDKEVERTNKLRNYTFYQGSPDDEYRSARKRLTKSLHMKASKAKKVLKSNILVKKSNKRIRPISPSRRHATNILVLTRSPKPGCTCPEKPGVPGPATIIEISADCFNSVNILLHLFMHILGLDHQHNSHDRDQFLHIVWDQLTEDVKKEMQKKLPPAASVGFTYDYQSVMHYPWLQIKNGRTNIMYPIWNDGWSMGHWQGMSSVDVQKINYLYNKQCELRREQAVQAELRMKPKPK